VFRTSRISRFSKFRITATGIVMLFLCLSGRVSAIELSELSSSEKKSLDLACEQTDNKNLCHQKQLYALEKIGRNTEYPALHAIEAEAHKNGCIESFSKGPALYAYCLKNDFKKWANSTHVKVQALDSSTLDILKTQCATELHENLTIFSECLVAKLPFVLRPESPSTAQPEQNPPVSKSFPKNRPPVLKPEQLFLKISPSIVYIQTDQGSGSGVVVGPRLILTNQHVIEDASFIQVYDSSKQYRATVFRVDASKDACILKISSGSLPPITATRLFNELKIGNPEGLQKTFSDGMISGKRNFEGQPFIQITAPIAPGSSGGGLFDENGRLIGITTGGLDDADLINFAIPIDAFGHF
jgi:hypothetical protein